MYELGREYDTTDHKYSKSFKCNYFEIKKLECFGDYEVVEGHSQYMCNEMQDIWYYKKYLFRKGELISELLFNNDCQEVVDNYLF